MRFAPFPALFGARSASLFGRLVIGAMLSPFAVAAQPGRLLIKGVPFYGWRETGQTSYPAKAETNPSIPAAQRMIAGYWRSDARNGPATDEIWRSSELSAKPTEGATLDSLVVLVRAGIPVYVEMTLTPVAHPLSPLLAALAASKKLTIPNAATMSGLLGAMVPVAEMARWSGQLGKDPARDTRMMTARVVVGFDDTRGIIVMHDPSFGPAWELPRAQFDEIIGVSDGDAILMAQQLASTLGLAVGISSGANLLGALMIQNSLGADGVVATAFADSNKKYLSTDLLRAEPVKRGYLTPDVVLVGASVLGRNCAFCPSGVTPLMES